jgi:hypothetical protein
LSNITGLLPNTISNLNASNLAFGVVSSALIYGNTLSNVQFSNITGLLPNTISNLNASNLAFGVVSSALIYGNLISNINSSNVTQPFANLVVSNALSTTNVTASGTVIIGPTPATLQANLHVERGNMFIGNSAVVGSSFTTTGPTNLLVFDNTSNATNGPNKIILFSNTVGNFSVGIGVTGLSATTASMSLWSYNSYNFYSGSLSSPYVVGGFTNGSTFTVGTVPSFLAKFYVTGSAPSSNIMARIDATSNVALATSGGGLVGISTLTPSANLHVVGNVYASNAIQTTNIFAAGFTSNASNTVFNYSTLTVPFISSTTLNVSSTANVSSLTANTMNILSTSNLGPVISSGQVVATGKTGVGVCPPIVYRQGGSATNWNAPGANTSTFAVTSGAVQMQCGANTMTGTTQFIPFPVAYTNNPTVLVTSYSTTGNIWVSSITATNFQVQANVALQFEWLSIGV